MLIEVSDEKLVPSREKSRGLMVYRLVEALRLNSDVVDEIDSLDLQENPRQTLLPFSSVLDDEELAEAVKWVLPMVRAREVAEVSRTSMEETRLLGRRI